MDWFRALHTHYFHHFYYFHSFNDHKLNSFNNFNYLITIATLPTNYYPLIYYPPQSSSSILHHLSILYPSKKLSLLKILSQIPYFPHLFTILSSSVHSLILLINYSFLYASLFRSLISFSRSIN